MISEKHRAIGEFYMEKSTEELKNELETLEENDLKEWLGGIEDRKIKFAEYFQQLCDKYMCNPSQLTERCSLSKGYLYKCRNGEELPSKLAVVKMGFGFGVTSEEMNKMLYYAGYKELYVKNAWDAIVLFCLQRGCNSYEVDQLLKENGFEKGFLNDNE